MSLNRRAAKRDKNEREIIEALQAAGATVQQLSAKGVPDLLVGKNGVNLLMEVKSKIGCLTEDEDTFFRAWQGQRCIVRSIDEALRALDEYCP